MKFERVAVTGGSGRLGRYVVADLRQHCAVTVVDRIVPDEDVPFAKVDILDRAAVGDALVGQDAVVHLAGIDLDRTVPADTFIHVNAVGTWNVLEAAEKAGVKRVVQCSSVTATGLNEARKDYPPQYLPVDEGHSCAPRHPYGVSKLLQEEIGRSFNQRQDFEVVSLRVMMVMFDTAYQVIAERLQDPDGRWLSYFVSPRDAARAFRCALKADNVPFDTIFITAQDTCREEKTLEWLAAELGELPEVRNPGLYAQNPRAAVFDGSRARDALGFIAKDNWWDCRKKTT